MKTEKEIRERISKVTLDNNHILSCYPATVSINALKTLMQLAAKTSLDELYWILGEERPKFKCDEFNKVDC